MRPQLTVKTFIDIFRQAPHGATFPGSYSLVFYTHEGNILSFNYCRENILDLAREIRDEYSSRPAWCDVYWEGPTVYCEGSSEPIESEYGDPDLA